MKISRKAEYAVRALLILASAPPRTPMQIQDLSERGSVPVKFLEQILLALKKEGLLRSKRGVGGGYQLDRPARSITVGEIIEHIDGGLCTLGELGEIGPGDAFPGAIGLQRTFEEADERLNGFLRSQTIEDVLNRDRPKDVMAFDI